MLQILRTKTKQTYMKDLAGALSEEFTVPEEFCSMFKRYKWHEEVFLEFTHVLR